jgi:para-aminobenzoate synthetase
MRTLLIDNHDSFTYNLFQLLAEVNGAEPVVVRNDEASWEELAAERFEAVVLSPGPGRPERAADFGLCAAAIARFEGPLLGVCLGHQGIGLACGGTVEPAPEPVHGRLSTVAHDGSPLFAGIPERFEAVRYHSLCLSRPLPSELEEIAWSEDGVPMAVARRSRPQWGVQFHPESVATEHGRRLLENFRDLAGVAVQPKGCQLGRGAFVGHSHTKAPRTLDSAPRLALRWRRIDCGIDPGAVFAVLYGEGREAFWLDSSSPGAGARFSFMGDPSGPLGRVVTYDVGSDTETIFDRLDRELARLPRDADLPFEFQCGFAGYLGYELKADCGAEPAHSSPHPDAALIFADRMLAFDHEYGHTYLLCLHGQGGEEPAVQWLSATEARLFELAEQAPSGEPGEDSMEPRRCSSESSPGSPHWTRPEQHHLADIAACQQMLYEGESYEICLTNSIETKTDTDPFEIYCRLRRLNPAPHAAYLRFGDLTVLSSSPERFLRVDREGEVEAKPIKGTAPRDGDPGGDALIAERLQADEKSRAENLMIADLLRNDLGRVCEVGSVEVPALMEVESYATVHQLVTTVHGRLRPGLGAVDAVRACFPAGSMTGAPKQRTMAIVDELEGGARGIYSGAIGWFGGAGDGAAAGATCDLAVTIRTIVVDRGRATIGSGGAIVVQSDPAAEWEEVLLKAAAPMRAIDPGTGAPISLTSAPEDADSPSGPREKTPTLTS